MRTRQALRTALMQLIQEKGFDSISVEEITDKANLGRATFYLHYKDKEDLLLEEFRDIARDRVQMLSETPISIWKSKLDSLGLSDGDTLSMPLFMIFEHAAQNADLYRISAETRRVRCKSGLNSVRLPFKQSLKFSKKMNL